MQALWMVLGAFLFATMGVCIKYASDDFNSFEIVFYRGLVGVIFLIGLTRCSGRFVAHHGAHDAFVAQRGGRHSPVRAGFIRLASCRWPQP